MLVELTAGSAEDAQRREADRPLLEVERAALAAPPALDAAAALAHDPQRTKVIAEVKRASPSRGDIAPIADPAALAADYASAGAAAISVLTEERRFKGSLRDLEVVRAAVEVPVLRKDFVSTPYQVLEARAAGADLVLLIVAALDDARLGELAALVRDLRMTALVETHSEQEVDRALAVGAEVIGVNARDLDTFALDRDLFGRIVERIPAGPVKVAESAVRSAADVAAYRATGADAVLVGEALVTGDPAALIHEFERAGA
ncbi:indole-3-glycerol phosphate synthase TrpC [Amnibacterium endophyticum]|uniref:indole-3-glycerol-phosphate synthase n=1 Tax=Amnibacterium endophyticum TaxID=2109337 RepID=A0ABW4LCW3_9MICO